MKNNLFTRSLLLVLVVVLHLFLSTACNKEGDPELSIKESKIELTKEEPEKSLLIANLGEGNLDWNVENIPQWLDVSPTSGSLEPGADDINFTGRLNFRSDEYNADVVISTNAGNKTIEISFNLDREEFTVLPGQGITNVLLGHTFSAVKNEIGIPDTVFHYQYDGQGANFVHESVYPYLGLVLFYFNDHPAIVNNSDQLVFIQCVSSDFEGTTEEGIGIGSSLNQIEDAYGTPSDTITSQSGNLSYEFYAYAQSGIGFYFFNGNQSKCEWIEVFPPVVSSAPLRKPLLNHNLQRKY
ncbi:MAG: hypothetical protein GVY19_10890 [Bacteroidetes bacterium]|jgi:hypothetical protein|nr:hypothetical protein [Bacteroidota bacterium]